MNALNPFAHTWYGALATIASYVVVYLLIGAYWGGRAQDAGWTADGDPEFADFLVTVFWVFVGLFMLIRTVGGVPHRLGASYTERKAERTGIEPPPRPLKGKVVKRVRESDYEVEYR